MGCLAVIQALSSRCILLFVGCESHSLPPMHSLRPPPCPAPSSTAQKYLTAPRLSIRHYRSVRAQAALTVTPQQLGLLGVATVTVIGAAGVLIQQGMQNQNSNQLQPQQHAEQEVVEQPLPRQNAVLVFGAGGKVGRKVVTELLSGGRHVVAATRGSDGLPAGLSQAGLQLGPQKGGRGALFAEGNADITDPAALERPELWHGVSQVAVAVGPLFGRQADGSVGYLDGMTSERVDKQGVQNIALAAKRHLKFRTRREASEVLPMRTTADLQQWQQLDDPIMGGQSLSRLQAAGDASANGNGTSAAEAGGYQGALWRGQVVTKGGGFCGARTLKEKDVQLGLERFDGLCLRVRGDDNASTFKVNLKTETNRDIPESTYQAQFETLPGEWSTVYMPWHEFVPVKRAQYDPAAEPLEPAKVIGLGLVLSRFEYNGLPNQRFTPGNFELQIDGGIRAFSDVKPAVVMLSSAAVERNAIIGDDAEARKRDIPIVQLNPGSTLNWKYEGENALRAAGLPYSIIRATGLTTEEEDMPHIIEAEQGDSISGKISRAEVAQVISQALEMPAAAGKTLEVRRCEAADAKGKATTPQQLRRMFYTAVEDRRRATVGLRLLPKPAPPPAPPSEERMKEILADDRVQAVTERGRKERLQARAGQDQNGNAASSGNGAVSKASKAVAISRQ